MDDFTLSAEVGLPYEEAVERVRAQLAEAGFGILTEIDLRATFRAKLDVETVPRIILGACRPPLAYRALQADPRIAALLPCNVVVTGQGPRRSLVEMFDPTFMTSFDDDPDLAEVTAEARRLLAGALDALQTEGTGTDEA